MRFEFSTRTKNVHRVLLLVPLTQGWELTRPDFLRILLKRTNNAFVHLCILLQKLRIKAFIQTKQVIENQNLTITGRPCANADGRYI